MSTVITTINSSDQITNSRADLNGNFASLNTNKIETSVIDTDTALAANSDAKIPSQKAVKAYVDAGGNVNASETARGIVQEATDAQVTAGTATGSTSAKLFVSPTKLKTYLATQASSFAVGTASKNLADATAATQTIAHGLGVAPNKVRITIAQAQSTSISQIADGVWYTGGIYSSRSLNISEGTTIASSDVAEVSNSYIIKLVGNVVDASIYQTATVAVDATNITLTWTKTGSPTGTPSFNWEAEHIL